MTTALLYHISLVLNDLIFGLLTKKQTDTV